MKAKQIRVRWTAATVVALWFGAFGASALAVAAALLLRGLGLVRF